MEEIIYRTLLALLFVSAGLCNQGPLPVKDSWNFRTSKTLQPLLFRSGDLIIAALDDEELLALKLDDGKPAWHYKSKAKILWPKITAAGHRQQMAHYQGLFAFCCADGSMEIIDLERGEKCWSKRFRTQPKWSPTVTPFSFCVVCDSDRVYGMEQDKEKELWSFQCRSNVIDPPKACNYGLLLSTKDRELLYIHGRTGELLWGKMFSGLATPPPLVTSEGIYVCTSDGYLVALSERDGHILWKQRIGLFAHGPLSWHDKVIVATKNGVITSIDGLSGNVLWQHQSTFAQPMSLSRFDSVIHSLVVSSHLLVYSTYFGDAMHGLALNSGRLLWRYGGGPDWTKPPSVNNVSVLFGNRDSFLHGMNGYVGTILWKARLDGPLATVPLNVGKRTIVGTTEGTIYAVDFPDYRK